MVSAGIGADVAGKFAAALAFFAWGWEPFDPAYAKECLAAAQDIYTRIIMPRKDANTLSPCCYHSEGPVYDDVALAAFALWFATKDAKYRYDLLENPALGTNPTAMYNQGFFPTGLLALPSKPFSHMGWTTDFQNIQSFVTYGLVKLF